MQATKTGTKVTDTANSTYIYSVYYDGKVYTNEVRLFSSEDEVFEREWYWDLNGANRVVSRINNLVKDKCGEITDAQSLALRVKALKAYIGEDFGKNFEKDYAVTYDGLSKADYMDKMGITYLPTKVKHDFHKGYRDIMISVLEAEYSVNTSGWDWSDF